MADVPPKEPRRPASEELGGAIGCLALLVAVALFLWLAFSAGSRSAPPHVG